jgi:hypothetical protein
MQACADLLERSADTLANTALPRMRDMAAALRVAASSDSSTPPPDSSQAAAAQASLRSQAGQVHAGAALLAEIARLAAAAVHAAGGNLLPLAANTASAVNVEGEGSIVKLIKT